MKYLLKNTAKDNDDREFDSKDNAEEQRKDLISLGAKPENLVIEETDGSGEMDVDIVDETGEAQTAAEKMHDGGTAPVKEPAHEPTVAAEMETDAEQELRNLGGDFTTEIKGTTVIKKKGLRVMQNRYDIDVTCELEVPPEETDHSFARAKAIAVMPDGQKAVAHGSASTERGDDSFLLTEMADTRAKSRVLSDITGIGHAVVEEMTGVDND